MKRKIRSIFAAAVAGYLALLLLVSSGAQTTTQSSIPVAPSNFAYVTLPQGKRAMHPNPPVKSVFATLSALPPTEQDVSDDFPSGSADLQPNIPAFERAEHSASAFSIVWLSDTQTMSYMRYPGRLQQMGEWIAAQRVKRNIRYVVQTGDAVENGFSDWQWAEFDTCYNEFKEELPFFAVAGNHDIDNQRSDYTTFLERDYITNLPADHAFENGRAAYATVSAGGMKILFLGAGWDSEESAIPWMNKVLQRHAEYTAILLFHSYIKQDGQFTVTGKQMFEQVVKPNPNVRLVLCGHVHGTGYRQDLIDDTEDGLPDRNVHALLYNYQDWTVDTGQLRVLTLDPLKHDLTVMTYAPPVERYYRDSHFATVEFTIEDAF